METKLITNSRGAGAWAFYGETLKLIFMPSHKSNLSRFHRLIERKNRRVFILLASESISFHFSTIKLKRCHSAFGMGWESMDGCISRSLFLLLQASGRAIWCYVEWKRWRSFSFLRKQIHLFATIMRSQFSHEAVINGTGVSLHHLVDDSSLANDEKTSFRLSWNSFFPLFLSFAQLFRYLSDHAERQEVRLVG